MKSSRPARPAGASRRISIFHHLLRRSVSLAAALGRVLAADVIAPVDAPPFDRSNVDGFAVRAADTTGASDVRRSALR